MGLYEYTKTPVCLNRLSLEITTSAITIALDHTEIMGTLKIYFKADLSEADVVILNALVAAHSGVPLIEVPHQQVEVVNFDSTSNVERAQKVCPIKPEGSSSTLVSHNFCDKTTWWTQSTRVVKHVPDTTDYLTYTSSHTYWIDLISGKVPYEDRISSNYKALVYADDVLVSASNFTIDYVAGSVTFLTSQEGKAITVTCSYAGGSRWVFKPDSGKVLKALGTQVKFTDDVSFATGNIVFQPFLANGSPAGSATVYKNIMDFAKCVSGGTSRLEKIGNMPHDVLTLDFSYMTSKDLKYSQGSEIRIWITDDVPLIGTDATMVAHVLSLVETV